MIIMITNYCRSPWVVAFKLRTHYLPVYTGCGHGPWICCQTSMSTCCTARGHGYNVYWALDRWLHSIFLLRLLPLHFAVSGIAKTAQCCAYQYALYRVYPYPISIKKTWVPEPINIRLTTPMVLVSNESRRDIRSIEGLCLYIGWSDVTAICGHITISLFWGNTA